MRTLIITVALTATLAFAQGPGPRRMARGAGGGPGQGANLEALKSALGLSDAQVDQLKQIRKNQFDANQSIHTEMRDKARQLREAMNAENPSAAQVGQLMVDLKAARKRLWEKQPELQKATRAILTPEQLAKLGQMEQSQKIAPAARQATGLGLLAPPEDGRGMMGMGMGMGRGPGGGPGAAPMRRGPRPVQ